MMYPSELIGRLGGPALFAEVASAHPLVPHYAENGQPRRLDAAAVYMWKARDRVPHMWRPVVSALLADTVTPQPSVKRQNSVRARVVADHG